MSKNTSKQERRPLIEAEERSSAQTDNKQKGFPKCIFFILGNEFCERYSYYGMRTILVLYLKYYLQWSSTTSTSVYHAFAVLAYFFPILGAILADSYWGKYNTILRLSIVYVIGMLLNTLGAIRILGNHTTHAVLSCIGLIVIAVGTGGIKSCVSAFGGDQFEADQEDLRRRFFSLFYFAINAGSLLSTFISPLVREKVQCFDYDCYALAFGIPAALMVVATVLFVLGTKWYKRVPPSDRIFFRAFSGIALAIKTRWNTPKANRDKTHWMDYASNATNATLVRDIKYVLRILVLYIPLPVFWTLFDQQGSRWTLQAVRMDGYVGKLHILPDQMQICNPLFIVTLIPLFEVTLYPCLGKLNINFSPLRKMALGMFLAGFSFVVAALVQKKIDINLTRAPSSMQQTSLRVINAASCAIKLHSNVYPQWESYLNSSTVVLVPPGTATNTKENLIKPGSFYISYACAKSATTTTESITLKGKVAYDFVVSDLHPGVLKHLLTSHRTEKSSSGKAFVDVINTLNTNVTILDKSELITSASSNTRTVLPVMDRGNHTINVVAQGFPGQTFSYTVGTGGLYTAVLKHGNKSSVKKIDMDFYTDIYQNDISIMWLVPQYFIITIGEVFLSVTGLEFSYSQSPPSMKAILQAIWLLTVSMGDIIVLIVAEARLMPNQADEYFLFSGLIGFATIVFILLAIRYKYVDETEYITDPDKETISLDDTMKNNNEKPTESGVE